MVGVNTMTKLGMKRTAPRKRLITSVRIDPLDKLFSTYIRMRANGHCERCLKPKTIKELQCCHYHGRSNRKTRWDEENCYALDAGCHNYFHAHPLEFTEWVQAKLGEERFNLLTARAYQNHSKVDRQAITLYLKAKLKELEQNE